MCRRSAKKRTNKQKKQTNEQTNKQKTRTNNIHRYCTRIVYTDSVQEYFFITGLKKRKEYKKKNCLKFMIEFFSIIVLISGITMSLGHFVQAHKMFSRKSAKDISLGFILIFFLGSIIWLIYGLLIKDYIVIMSFGIGALGTSLLLLLKLKYDSKLRR